LGLSLGAAPPTAAVTRPAGPEIFGPGVSRSPISIPPGFHDDVAWSGLVFPTVVQFASNEQVFVGEKGGRIRRFDGLGDPAPTTVANLSTAVYDFADRGLLGLALDPDFPTTPDLFVLYTLDAPIGQAPPVYHDDCADPLGDGCVVGARLSRLTLGGNGMAGPETVLIEGWCQQFPSHSIGTLAFGPDGSLFVGAGDGASFEFVDWGQSGNPCADPPLEGGALRSQDARTGGDALGYDGAILRVDPASPATSAFVATGLRNPFRFTFKPGTDRIYVGDVGWNDWEEVDRIPSGTAQRAANFGWPCFEGQGVQPGYDGADLPICEALYGGAGKVTGPVLALSHGQGGCTGSNVMSGIEFYEGGSYPPSYTGRLFFADTVRGCIWTMKPKTNGDPDPTSLKIFSSGTYAVDLKLGPEGDVFYVDFGGGAVRRISYAP
jgi:glucose/arabinose dehydrogenase